MLTSEATVPKITVITRKAYGGSYLAMCSQDLGADQVYAWPTSEIAVMGPAGAANIIFKKDEDKDAKTAKYVEEFATPYKAAERGFVDVVIEPKQTRPAVINALAMLASKRENRAPKKHGNIPFIIRFGKHIIEFWEIPFFTTFLERGMIMEGQAVTTNPWLIMAINMTVVFAVLIALGILMEIVHLIDPTKKKKEAPAATAPVATPTATPVAPANASAQK